MNWFPNIPTDSLHKYLALNGLWFLFGIISLLTFLSYHNFEHEEFNKKRSWLASKQDAVHKFKTRIDSINKGKFSENMIPGISRQSNPKEELNLLKNGITLNENDIKNLSSEAKEQPKSLFPFLIYIHIEVLLIVFLFFSSILAFLGFKNWFKIQNISDEIQKHDLELKRLELTSAKRVRVKRNI